MALYQSHVTEPIYKSEIFLAIGNTEELNDYWLTVQDRELDFSNKGGIFTFNDQGQYIICLNEDTVSATLDGVLEHETLHLCFQVLRDVGIKLNKSNEEAFTYYYEMVIELLRESLHASKKQSSAKVVRNRRAQPRNSKGKKQKSPKVK